MKALLKEIHQRMESQIAINVPFNYETHIKQWNNVCEAFAGELEQSGLSNTAEHIRTHLKS